MKPITYNARPIGGAPLPDTLELFGDWEFTPKVNGWRTLVHTPTGTMFNRKGELLSISKEFDRVLNKLSSHQPWIEWLDCEAFERRHPLGKGSLVILDAVIPGKTHKERQQLIYTYLTAPGTATSWPHETMSPPENTLLTFAYAYETIEQQHRNGCIADGDIDPHSAWERLLKVNEYYGHPLFEGLVAKREDSLYPIQLHSPDQTTPDWIKYKYPHIQ